jgi:hypothetical protein
MIDRGRLEFFCQGCHERHVVDLTECTWNHSDVAPTVHQVINISDDCVVRISDGYATYAVESTHSLSGQTCLLSEIL